MPTFHDLDGNVTLGPCRARLASWSDVHGTPAGDAPSRSDPVRQPVRLLPLIVPSEAPQWR